MKTMTTLATAAALLAGVTIASAQATKPSERGPGADSTQQTQGAPQPGMAPAQPRSGMDNATRPSDRSPVGADSTQQTQGAPQPGAGTVGAGGPKAATPSRPSERSPAGADSTTRTQGAPQPTPMNPGTTR
ncbi:MAG TPA: hypothetical protein VNQ99_10650 [Xanthobacteraceae bacterium]|nr:hypothetical protein [Xanthobacteraceae bacterium]